VEEESGWGIMITGKKQSSKCGNGSSSKAKVAVKVRKHTLVKNSKGNKSSQFIAWKKPICFL